MIRAGVRAFSILTAVAALGGCAEHWQKPGATPAQLQADQAVCDARGRWLFPPHMESEMVTPGYYTPPVTTCYTNSKGVTQCYTTPGTFEPPIFAEFDLNGQARAQDRHDCMVGKGWQVAK